MSLFPPLCSSAEMMSKCNAPSKGLRTASGSLLVERYTYMFSKWTQIGKAVQIYFIPKSWGKNLTTQFILSMCILCFLPCSVPCVNVCVGWTLNVDARMVSTMRIMASVRPSRLNKSFTSPPAAPAPAVTVYVKAFVNVGVCACGGSGWRSGQRHFHCASYAPQGGLG